MSMYRDYILDHYKNPRNRGVLVDFTHYSGKINNPLCGDELEVWIKSSPATGIEGISFDGHGCAICIASASLLTEWAKERTIQDIQQMNSETVINVLGIPLTPIRLQCALLARDGLWQALRDSPIIYVRRYFKN